MIAGAGWPCNLDTACGPHPSLLMALNAEWHREHPMPTRASLAQRVAWHQAHARVCDCRPIPPDIMIAIDRLERPKGKRPYRPR